MPPYSELQEPVTPTYRLENSVSKEDDDNVSKSIAVGELSDLPLTDPVTYGQKVGNTRPRRPRRRVQSMNTDSEGAKDFFTSSSCNHRYERKGSAPEAHGSADSRMLRLLHENESIQKVKEENTFEDTTKPVMKNDREYVKADAVTAKNVGSNSAINRRSMQEPMSSNQPGTSCSCVIL